MQDLRLCSCRLHSEQLVQLSETLAGSSALTALDLRDQGLRGDGAAFVTRDVFATMPNLKALQL